MDPKRFFFTLVFGLFGGYLVWTGLRSLRRPPTAGSPSSTRGTAGHGALISLAVGLFLWVALLLMYGLGPTAP